MAKMFYTMDETKAALSKSEEEVRQLARDGRLREFRDGQRLMFKTDQVDRLKGELASGTEPLDINDADSGLALSLADSEVPIIDPSSSGSGIALADSAAGTKGGSTVGVAPKSAAADDTALAADLGLSGSVSGMPSSGRAASASTSHSSRSGIDVFGADEAEKIDPSAATSVAPGLNADQLNIESVGSGSGLLDLTRESDDTSLGAELMDEIAPGSSTSGTRRPPSESALSASALGASASAMSSSGTGVGLSDPRTAVPGPGSAARVPAIVEAPDPLAPAFGLAALGAAFVALFAAFALMCGLAGNHPDILAKMGSSAPGSFSFIIVLGMAFALPVIMFVVGLVAAKTGKK